MKYCISYNRGSRFLDTADEIVIRYTEKNANLLEFLAERPAAQRIIIDCSADIEESMIIFNAAHKEHPNLAIMVSEFSDYSLLKNDNIPFFFNFDITSLDTLYCCVKEGVSDVSIAGEIGFSLGYIKKFCSENGVSVRVKPNIASPVSNFNYQQMECCFFVRPEDLYFYQDCIDVLDFCGTGLQEQDTVCEIYRSGRFTGKISELVAGLPSGVDNESIPPYFGSSRVNCGKRCCLGRCNVCSNCFSLGEELTVRSLDMHFREG